MESEASTINTTRWLAAAFVAAPEGRANGRANSSTSASTARQRTVSSRMVS